LTGGIENDHCLSAAFAFCNLNRASENDQMRMEGKDHEKQV